eukprot:jgi/Tetstr1/433086/TSEL_022418.t1
MAIWARFAGAATALDHTARVGFANRPSRSRAPPPPAAHVKHAGPAPSRRGPSAPPSARRPRASTSSPRVFSQTVEEHHGLLAGRGTPSRAAAPGAVDYASEEDGVLSLPLTQELTSEQLRNVFGFPRHVTDFYTIKDVVGAGSFGVVRKAVEHQTHHEYAVKSVPKTPKKGKPTPRYLLKIQTEVEAMMQVGASLNAVFLKDVFEDKHYVHMVMELCTGGPLLDRFESGEIVRSEQEVARQIRSVLRFLAQCHAKGIIFRDVKPDNFLFLDKALNSPLKATDFGLSIRHWPQEGNLKSRSGTPAYMAPEVIMQDYNEKCDLWSTGMLMYQLLTGTFPFWDNIRQKTLQEVWKSILVDKLDLDTPELRAQMSALALDLLRKLLIRDPNQRLSAAEALQHPWIKELDEHTDIPLQGSVLQRLQRFATYGRMKQMVLLKVAEEIIRNGDSSLAELKMVFDSIDLDGSGALSMEELSVGLREQGYMVTNDEVQQLMSRMDMNMDGELEFGEVVTALIDWDTLHTDAAFGMAVDTVFSKLDKDKSGYLSSVELMPLLPSFLDRAGEDLREAEAKRMMREIDTTHHGKLDKSEFVAILMDSYGEDALQQYDDRLYHDPDYSSSVSEAGAGKHS